MSERGAVGYCVQNLQGQFTRAKKKVVRGAGCPSQAHLPMLVPHTLHKATATKQRSSASTSACVVHDHFAGISYQGSRAYGLELFGHWHSRFVF